ncbi:hypothetical protein LSTR_LSTR004314 [Laodelphax striatellus]|uniref:AEBP2-like C-terminal SH3 domain-containing protein n=1 Tax=Laodelphax striatellus TaxID=195883 RepID=A0A482X894_LAOST|nr:hypothetical protein LSTR_LSTR004314 [Laodelphax striatellus]
MLERHVNGHFNQSDSNGSGASGTRKSLETAPNKLFRRNGKKLRYRRQPFSARIFDYFDSGTMEKLQERLIKVTESGIEGDLDQAGNNYLTLHSKVLGRRTELDGKTSYMLRWYPTNVLNDEWVSETEVRATRRIALSQLPADCTYASDQLLSCHRPDRRRRSRKQRPRSPLGGPLHHPTNPPLPQR